MKQLRLYLIIILPLLAVTAWLLYAAGKTVQVEDTVHKAFSIMTILTAAIHNPLSGVLIQLILILVTAKGLGRLFARFGQQAVMGEIVAGILLGPSFLGLFFPDTFHTLFPADSLMHLSILSQLGLLIFMFVIGMELDIDALRQQVGRSLVISHSSIAFPFLLGVGFAYYTYSDYGNISMGFVAYALFMGIAMSITAFPVLVRILRERDMTATPIGALALICAAINDVTAWCILPVVVAVTKAESMTGVLVTITLTIAFVASMIFIVRPLLERYSERRQLSQNGLGLEFISLAVILHLVSALIAEVIGIHALFGAFVAGAVMPPSKTLRHELMEKLEPVSVSLLLPVFFVMTGLRTSIGMLSGNGLWPIFVCILLLATAGKLLGSAIPARLSGLSWRDSFTMGALMNTRGLMELIVLNIGYDLGVLSPAIFTMMVFMALVTTFMTAPLLNLIERSKNN